MKTLDDQIAEHIRVMRDANRPTMESVVRVMERIFTDVYDDARIVCLTAGPTTWVWKDETMEARGLDKFYVLSESALPDCPGYPLLTIRQAYSAKLDSWISASSLIAGSTDEAIMQGVSLMVGNHLGAFSGFRYAMNASIAAGSNPKAGLAAGRAIMEAADGRFVVAHVRSQPTADDDEDLDVDEPDGSAMN